MDDRVKTVLDRILDQFKNSEAIPEIIALATFPATDMPMHKWSLLNQLICSFNGQTDFRGYKQWIAVNRHVKKGEKATLILVPRMRKEKNENNEDIFRLNGFLTGSVFSVEQTEGEPLAYEQIELPELPLMDRARELGIDIKAIPGNDNYYGYYSRQRKVIALASPEFCVFAHEITHLADDKMAGQDTHRPIKEIIAELGALALCNIVGLDGNKHIGNQYRYIESYAKDLGITPHAAVLTVISRTEKILKFLLKEEQCPIEQ